jgi:hypothetical protein
MTQRWRGAGALRSLRSLPGRARGIRQRVRDLVTRAGPAGRRLARGVAGNALVRLGPALTTAVGIALVVGGLLTYDASAGSLILPTPAPTPTPLALASPTSLPTLPFRTPGPTAEPTGTASRIVIPAMRIDLPVIEGNEGFPYCNVAMYQPVLAQPGRPGTTYIYAHARVETFLRLLTLSQVRNGAPMLGMLVQVYTTEGRLYLYEIDAVRRHVTTNGFVANPPVAGEPQDLILQTSEGPRFTERKLQVHARYLYSQDIDPAEANPAAHPVTCF